MQVNSLKLNKIFATANTEYMKWICNFRMLLLLVVAVFINGFAVEPLKQHAEKIQSPLNVLEPFIATVNSEVLVIIIPAVFLALMSDFPRTDGNTLFFIQRIGKKNWVIGQILFSIYAIFTYVAAIFLATVIPSISTCYFGNYWSIAVSKYADMFPSEANSFGCLLIKKNVYNQVSPWYAAIQGYAIMMLYLFVIVLIMLVFRTLQKKVYGMLTSVSIIAIGGTSCLAKMKLMWCFPMAHASVWFHYTKYYRSPVMTMWKSYLYFLCVIVFLITLALRVMGRMNFDSVQEID